jgi:hypothetical protein
VEVNNLAQAKTSGLDDFGVVLRELLRGFDAFPTAKSSNDPQDSDAYRFTHGPYVFDLPRIPPSDEPSFFLPNNPLYCGTKLLDIAIEYEYCGLGFAMDQGSPFNTAHLYNALQQTGSMETQWPEMDRLIQVHMQKFFGSQPPTTYKEFESQYMIQGGVL